MNEDVEADAIYEERNRQAKEDYFRDATSEPERAELERQARIRETIAATRDLIHGKQTK